MEIRVEQIPELFWRKGEGEIIKRLIDFEHDTEKGYFPFEDIMNGVNGSVFIKVLLFGINIFNKTSIMDLDFIRDIRDEHPVQRVVILFDTVIEGVFHVVLGELKKATELVLVDYCALVVLV